MPRQDFANYGGDGVAGHRRATSPAQDALGPRPAHPDETGSVPEHGDCSEDVRGSVPVAPAAGTAVPARRPCVTPPGPHSTLQAPRTLAAAEALRQFVRKECPPGYRPVPPPGRHSLWRRSTPSPTRAVTSVRTEGVQACLKASPEMPSRR